MSLRDLSSIAYSSQMIKAGTSARRYNNVFLLLTHAILHDCQLFLLKIRGFQQFLSIADYDSILGGVVCSFIPLSSSSGSILKVGYLESTLSYHLVFFAWKYLRVSLFENERFMKIRSCRPALPTYRQINQPKMKKWVNFGNFWPIHLQFGMQVPFTHPHAAVKFGNDPTIFSPTNPTYQKVAYSDIFKLS